MEPASPLPTTSIPAWPPPPRQKSPGLAFVLSLFLPGLGQFYCGKMKRGAWTLVFFVLSTIGVVFLFDSLASEPAVELFWGMALRTCLVLYGFSFVDSFFTAREMATGIDPHVVENPRVAAVLNLLTRGFGYWYVGERKKGLLAFFLLGVASRVAITVENLLLSNVLGVFIELVLVLLAVDAYRIACDQLRERLDVLSPTATPLEPPPGFDPAVPVGLAGLLALGYVGLVALSLAMPDYSLIDQSQAVIAETEERISYSNPKYGVAMHIPPSWELDNTEPTFFVQGLFLGGVCQASFMAEPALPFLTLEYYADGLTEQILSQNPNLRLEASSAARLADLPGRELIMIAQAEGTELHQHYFLARRGLSLYAFVTTTVTDFEELCKQDLEDIRRQLVISK